MKIINRSSSSKKIEWSIKDISTDNVSETVLRFKNLVLSQGTSAFNQINKELNTKSPKSTVADKIFAIQIRLYCPKLGWFKGILMKKMGITKVELPESMKK